MGGGGEIQASADRQAHMKKKDRALKKRPKEGKLKYDAQQKKKSIREKIYARLLKPERSQYLSNISNLKKEKGHRPRTVQRKGELRPKKKNVMW